MPRALFVSITIVAAFQLQLDAANAPVEDARLTPEVVALARGLGVDPSGERGRFMADLVAQLYRTIGDKSPTLTPTWPAIDGSDPITTVPVPLTAATWSRTIFRRAITSDQLIVAILRDPRAALLCRGLSGVDDETLDYLTTHPLLLTFLYEEAAAVVAGLGDVLRIRNQRLVLPGDADAIPLWEAVLGTTLSDPERAVRVLLGERSGRLAYLASVIAAAEPPAASFALGQWIDDPTARAGRFGALAAATTAAYREWHAYERPLSRPLGDLAMLLTRIRVDASGAPAPPVDRAFWAEVFDVGNALPAAPNEVLPDGSVDLAWLVSVTGDLDMYARAERLDQFAFGQRLFDRPLPTSDAAAAVEIVRSFPRRRMLLLTLERLGLRSIPLYLSALQRADALEEEGGARRFWNYSQFQGALALIARMQRADSIKPAATERLVGSLSAVPLHDGGYRGALARWIETELAAVLPPGSGWEDRVLHALSGDADAKTPRIPWEGETYRLDRSAAERQRLAVVRRKQQGHTLDVALAINGIASRLRRETPTIESVQRTVGEIRVLVERFGPGLRHPSVNLLPPGVSVPRDGLEWLTAAVGDLQKITRPGELRRAQRIGESLEQLGDIVLGNALVSIVYAADLGDPEGAALLAGNVALRHDFGLGRRDADTRAKLSWGLPRQDFQPGVPWHVSGSLLGLDIALAPMQLRRYTIDRVADAPKLSSTEREALAVGVSLIDPRRLKDEDLAAIAGGVAEGRRRIAALASGAEPIGNVVDQLGLDGWRERSLRWSVAHDPSIVAGQFSLVDTLILGGGAPGVDLDAWGPAGLYRYGCACSRFAGPRAWRLLEGRYQMPTVAATMGDLNLAVGLMLHDMHLPAALMRPVLAVGMQDFIDDLVPAGSGEWWGMSRQAQTLRRYRIEDYVSAAAAVGGPLVPDLGPAAPQD